MINEYRPIWLTKAAAKVRRQRGLSQCQLARRIGCTESALKQFESGNQFSLTLLRKIAVALDVSFWDIMKQAEV